MDIRNTGMSFVKKKKKKKVFTFFFLKNQSFNIKSLPDFFCFNR